jgi:rRNA maturation RNase YbeY
MIPYFYEDIEPLNISLKKHSEVISYIIDNEGFNQGDISIIFCSDTYLLGLNQKHLNHNYFTDIITFSYSDENELSGDLFISLDRVKENAVKEKKSFKNELERVLYHGVLHLCGYKDKSPEEIAEMRSKEDYYLNHNVSRGT